MIWRSHWILIVLFSIGLSCAAARPGQACGARAVAFSDTWLLHLPGIGGERRIEHNLIDGLADGGWDGPITIYDWTEKDPGLDALRNYKRNQREAQKVAWLIEKRLRNHPGLRITLTSHSGGTGIAVWALERLPRGMKVQTLVLLASALSPHYDLSKALAHVRGKAYVFYSKNDQLVLGIGTTLFGTIDGVKSDAAGLVGFHRPAGADKCQYARLIQKPYDRSWMAFNNIGNHVGCMSRPFAQNVLAPLLIASLADDRPSTMPSQARGQTGPTAPAPAPALAK